MRNYFAWACAAFVLGSFVFAHQPAGKRQANEGQHSRSGGAPVQENLNQILESKVRAAWETFQKKDRKTYAYFLADDFIAVEADNEGTRNKWRVLREVESSMVQDYTLSVFKVTPLGSDAAFVTYEALIHFPAKSAVRFERMYIGEVWLKRDAQWKELHYQETRVK